MKQDGTARHNPMTTKDKKPVKDARKERLAKQLRANLQRRKEQARERGPGERADTGAGRTGGKPDSPGRDT